MQPPGDLARHPTAVSSKQGIPRHQLSPREGDDDDDDEDDDDGDGGDDDDVDGGDGDDDNDDDEDDDGIGIEDITKIVIIIIRRRHPIGVVLHTCRIVLIHLFLIFI